MTCHVYSSNSQVLNNYDKIKPIGINVTECDRLINPLRKHAQFFVICSEVINKDILYGYQLGDNLITESSALFKNLETIGENASTCAYDKKKVKEQGVKLDCAMQVNNLNRIKVGTLLVRTYDMYNSN